MEQLFYILDTTTDTKVIENLTHEQAVDWIKQYGSIISHILVAQ